MKLQLLHLSILLTLLVVFNSCDAQIKLDSSKDKEISKGEKKIVKNNFFPELDEEFKFVQCGLQDKNGNMWFGTAGNGIYFYDGKSFFNFSHKSFVNFSIKDDLNHSDILCCTEDKAGNIWFGTRRGLIRYSPTKNKPEAKDFTLILIPANTISDSSRTPIPYAFQSGDNFVWSIMQDKSTKIWFGTSTGVFTYDPSNDFENNEPLFRRFLDNDSLINDQQLQLISVTGMLQDKNGSIWFSSAWTKGEGIVQYDGQSLTNYLPDGIDAFRSIIERKNGDILFLNSFHGVYSFDGKIFSNLTEKIGVKGDTLVSMLEDQESNLWFGHSTDNVYNGGNGGLWYYDGKTLKLFTTKNGLSHNHVFSIVSDRDGNIWVGTRRTGLCRYNGETFTNFTQE